MSDRSPTSEAGSPENDTPGRRQLILFDEPLLSGIPDDSAAGVDDMNILEIVLGLPGRRRPPRGTVKTVPWKKGERSHWVEYSRSHLTIEWLGRSRVTGERRDFYVNVETPESKGLPTALAEDVFVALMKCTADQQFDGPEIQRTRNDLISMMGWHRNGQYYQRLDEILSQFVRMTVSTNALWDPEDEAYFTAEFNILDSVEYRQGDAEGPVTIIWGQKIMDIFSRNYMKFLDTRTYYAFSSQTAKRVYRWLDKQLSIYPQIQIDVLRFAHRVLGLGVSYTYPSQVLQKLEEKLNELTTAGVATWEYVDSDSDSGKKFVFTRIFDYATMILPTRENVVDALRRRGVDHPQQLVEDYMLERCLKQIAYFDWRTQHDRQPVDNPGGFLAERIRNDRPLPKGLRDKMESARERTVEWADRMYANLSDEEKSQVDYRVEELLKANDVAGDVIAKRRQQFQRRLIFEMSREL